MSGQGVPGCGALQRVDASGVTGEDRIGVAQAPREAVSAKVALSMFMRRLLEADGSCQKAVNGWAAQRAADGLSPISVHTGGYAQVPVDELMRRPLQVRPVRGGHVLVRGGVIAASAAQGVTGHALVGLETLHQGLGDAQIHRGAKQRVGHAVAAGHLAGLWTSS